MSQSQFDSIKAHLKSLGLVEGEDYSVHAGRGDSVSFSLELEIDPDTRELPEELKPYALSSHELERYMNKGNSGKETWTGAQFEVALRRYASEILHSKPEMVEFSARIRSGENMPSIEEYNAKKAELWAEICARPQIAAWERDLDENYL